MENDKNAAHETSPLSDYLIREQRAHGRKSRETFKVEDLRSSLLRKSSKSMVLRSKDDKGREKVKGKAKVRYEANNLFSVSEIRAFGGRFSGDAAYTPGREKVWHWDVFPPAQWPRATLLGSLIEYLNSRIHRALTGEETSELQAMVERAMADYLALDKTQQLIAEIDKVEALADQEWAMEEAMYKAKFGGAVGDSHPHE